MKCVEFGYSGEINSNFIYLIQLDKKKIKGG